MALIGHWPLQDASLPTAVGLVGGNGTYRNSPTLQATGPGGGYPLAVDFNGTNQDVLCPTLAASGPISIAGWINWDAPGGDDVIASWGVGGGYTAIIIRAIGAAGVNVNIWAESNTFSAGVVWADTPQNHVAVTIDATDLCTLYMNGSFVSTYQFSGTMNLNGPVYIGSQLGSTRWMDGRLADIRVYNHALSAAEVTAIYDLVANPGGGGGVEPQRFQLNSIRRGSYVVQSAGLNGALS